LGNIVKKKLGIVDYGAGNILNVKRAFESLKINVEVIDNYRIIKKFSHLVLPGVGSFSYGIDNLVKYNFKNEIEVHVNKEKPLLGICLGMQLLCEKGTEGRFNEGLGLVTGEVKKISHDGQVGSNDIAIPHTGWSEILWEKEVDCETKGLQRIKYAYFSHSYMYKNFLPENVVAYTNYHNINIPTIIFKKSIVATQFHPEKSGIGGLRFLNSWYDLSY
jgi:glutamine amidotransferase